MSRPRRLLALLCLVLTAASVPAKTPLFVPGGLDDSWRRYLVEDTAREPSVEFPYEGCFRRSAEAHGLPVTLLLAVARGESDFDRRAVSSANALGVMQILWPGTAHHLGIHRRSALFEPCTNIDAGARYLKELLGRYRGDLNRALAAYNYGPSRVPVSGGGIPRGAQWYSGYIYRHLGYVLGSRSQTSAGAGEKRYGDTRKLPLIAFGTPYRASAFVETLLKAAPGVHLDWFRRDVNSFTVVIQYASKAELARGKRMLDRAGFKVR